MSKQERTEFIVLQIVDELLGIEGESKKEVKKVGEDVGKGKEKEERQMEQYIIRHLLIKK